MNKLEILNTLIRGLEGLEGVELDGNEIKKTKIRLVYKDENDLYNIKKFIEYVMNESSEKSPWLNDIISKIEINQNINKSINYVELRVREGRVAKEVKERLGIEYERL